MAHRYWRIYVDAPDSGSYTAIQELELRAIFGGADLTGIGEGTASASSSFAGGGGTAAFDGNLTDLSTGCWVSGAATSPQWIAWAFSVPKSVLEVAILPQARSDLANRGPRNFRIQFSDDGVGWTDSKVYTGITGWTVGVWKIFQAVEVREVGGTAKLGTEDPAEAVLITNLTPPHVTVRAIPASDGSWSAVLELGDYVATAVGPAGYRPQTHRLEVE